MIRALLAVLCLFPASLAAQERTSKNDDRLKRALQRFPQADANKDGVLTMKEAREFLQKRRGNRPRVRVPITHADVAYGPHARNRLDLWIARNDKPTPLLICIHGGGFRGGDKRSYHNNPMVKRMLDAGISVATINYRLTEGGKHPYPIPMHDGARAVQFLRHNAKKYNLDPKRFAATGGSAGACMLMWLGFHDDMAKPGDKDGVMQQSSRLQVLAPNNGQSCLHLPTLVKWFGVKSLREHPALRPLFGIKAGGKLEWTKKLDTDSRDASPLTHLSKDDKVACYMTFGRNAKVTEQSNPGLWVHHPMMGFKLKEAMTRLGLECHVQYAGGKKPEGYADQADFIVRTLRAIK